MTPNIIQQIKHSRLEIIYHGDVKFTLQEWVNGLYKMCSTHIVLCINKNHLDLVCDYLFCKL